MSPPASDCYLIYDEHHSRIPAYVRSHHASIHFNRWADDLDSILVIPLPLSPTNASALFNSVSTLIQHQLYEHDIPASERQLRIIPDLDSDKFLDSDVNLFHNNSRIKLCYHNKNASTIFTGVQDIGRFHHALSNSHIRDKLAGPTAILIRIYDYTSFPHDMLPAIRNILGECTLLGYTSRMTRAILSKSNRARPSHIWALAE